MDISAVIQSRVPLEREIPGVTVVPHVGVYEGTAGMLDARLAALRKVETKWFFYLDDDDELPEDYERVLRLCMGVTTKLAYTNELVVRADGSSTVRRPDQYSIRALKRDPYLFHHLVVCDTASAKLAADLVPRGEYLAEMLLFPLVAESGGATHIDEIGYIWNKGEGIHTGPGILFAVHQSAKWAYDKFGPKQWA